jgi:hypothetical protein
MTNRHNALSIAAAAAIIAATLALAAPAHADYPSDVEGARMNARAGGPTNAHDAELLKRWGATSTSHRQYSSQPTKHRPAYRYAKHRHHDAR